MTTNMGCLCLKSQLIDLNSYFFLFCWCFIILKLSIVQSQLTWGELVCLPRRSAFKILVLFKLEFFLILSNALSVFSFNLIFSHYSLKQCQFQLPHPFTQSSPFSSLIQSLWALHNLPILPFSNPFF